MNTDIMLEALSALKRPTDAHTLSLSAGLSPEDGFNALNELVACGRAVLTKHYKYAPLKMMEVVLCKARVMPNAPAFGVPVDGGDDYYLDMVEDIPMNGDLIHVRPIKSDRPRGTVVKVVKRAHSIITGSLFVEEPEPISRRKSKKHSHPGRYKPVPVAYALISDRKLPSRIEVEGDFSIAQSGDLCLFEISKYPKKGSHMKVRIQRVIGLSDDITARLSALIAENGIEEAFSEAASNEAAALPDNPCEADIQARRSLAHITAFTIDGADAQDFDDAVSLEKTEDGYILGVHIADVSHYVRPSTALDADARARGTSVYLPGRTIPMLPEALCNNLCSLKPDVNRLTFSLLLKMRDTEVLSYELFPSVIRSRARLTYDDVNALFAGEENTVPEEIRESLFEMNALAKRLTEKRTKRGAIELELPEPQFNLAPDGTADDVRARERGDAHRLIEEFMLLANETVAAHANKLQLPFPYRVHEAPDAEKLSALETLLVALGRPKKVGSAPSPAKLQEVLNLFKNRPQSVIVSRTLLRSMSKARYLDKPLGHYGLAARDYCHFTSPIRRYPDLLAHRMLRLSIEGKMNEETEKRWGEKMAELTREASECEERAAVCERDGDALLCASYLSKHIGEVFTGTVTYLGKRGAFVVLPNTAEGRIPPQLMDDFYSMDEDRTFMMGAHTHKMIRLGDKIRVEVYEVNIAAGEVEFAMAPDKPKRRYGKTRG
ncbi:MAG: ribonuclease R [Clostridia bacterium]|nr:ribonuclease R [Clostridia bacterium]